MAKKRAHGAPVRRNYATIQRYAPKVSHVISGLRSLREAPQDAQQDCA
jgi:hypothetical protein